MLNVLVADDEFANLETVSAALEGAGHRVLRAGDGIDALRILATHVVDIVVSDEHMPGLGGAQLIEAMQAEPRLARIPIIVMIDPFSRGRLPFTAATLLHKPIMIPQLLGLVEQAHRDAR